MIALNTWDLSIHMDLLAFLGHVRDVIQAVGVDSGVTMPTVISFVTESLSPPINLWTPFDGYARLV